MRHISLLPLLMVATGLAAQQAPEAQARIENALSAAPPEVSQAARVIDFEGNVLREGTGPWTCIPSAAEPPNNAPMCVDEPWLEFLDAHANRREPRITRIGIGYMLQGDYAVSNTDPFASAPTPDNQWLAQGHSHIMLVFPDRSVLDALPTDPHSGGPYVMWAGTPWAHLMVPVPPGK